MTATDHYRCSHIKHPDVHKSLLLFGSKKFPANYGNPADFYVHLNLIFSRQDICNVF